MQIPPSLKSGGNFMKGAECRTGKIMKKFSDFYFASYHRKLGWWRHRNDTKMTTTWKIKIRIIWNLAFLFSQPIAVLSCKLSTFRTLFYFNFGRDQKSKHQNPETIKLFLKFGSLFVSIGMILYSDVCWDMV